MSLFTSILIILMLSVAATVIFIRTLVRLSQRQDTDDDPPPTITH